MKKILFIVFIAFTCNLSYAQYKIKTDWNKLEEVLSNTQLKEFTYKKGSLYNEAEGISEDEEIPSALFFELNDAENKNKALVVSFQPIEVFKQDGIIAASKAYTLDNKQAYYRETDFILCLYVEYKASNIVMCIACKKDAMRNQAFIENILVELLPEKIIKAGFKQ